MIRARGDNPQHLLHVTQNFLANCASPAVLEYGEEPISLKENYYSLEIRSGRLVLEVWDETRSVSRRISAVERSSTGLLECSVERFGGKPGRLTLIDLDRPQTARRFTTAGKQHFAERFRRILSRQFPGWRISALSTGLDQQHSFSSVFPRARLHRGQYVIAAVACPASHHESALLTYALLWHSHISSLLSRNEKLELCLFLPDDAGRLTAHRLRWLNPGTVRYRIFLFNEHGSAGEVDAADLGNLETIVTARYKAPDLSQEIKDLLERIRHVDGVGIRPELNGSISISCRGLEFARIETARIWLGIKDRRSIPLCQTEELEQFALRLCALTTSYSNGLCAPPAFPERWFESAVRSHWSVIDAELRSDPVHGQVLSFAAIDRDLIDLLAITHNGVLVVMELKVAEDIHLPLQALDYWIRIRWHAERHELDHLFPGARLQLVPPKLLLIAPALSFHPATDTLLRYFAPDILVERVGVNTCWQKELKVVLRLRGAEVPVSQQPGQDSGNL